MARHGKHKASPQIKDLAPQISPKLTPAETYGLIFAFVGIFLGLVLGSLAAAGVVDMSAARYMLIAAWVFLVIGAALVEKLSARTLKRVLLSASITAIAAAVLLLALNTWMVRKKAEQEHKQPPNVGEWLLPITTYTQGLPWLWIAAGFAFGFLVAFFLSRVLRQSVNKRQGRITKLEQEEPERKLKESNERISQLQSKNELQERTIASLEGARDALQSHIDQHRRLYELMELQRKQIQQYVVVENCMINPYYLSESTPYIDFDFNVFNGSIYEVSIPIHDGALLNGSIRFRNSMLSGSVKLVNNYVKNCSPGGRNHIRVRQWVNKDDTKEIRQSIRLLRVACHYQRWR